MLFVLYINDLPNSINSDIYLFDDDAKLFRFITSPIDQEILPSDFDKIKSVCLLSICGDAESSLSMAHPGYQVLSDILLRLGLIANALKQCSS